MAKLYYRYGAMNSGKTTALLQVAFNYNERGMRVLILKASVDTKGGDHIVSRLGVSHKVDVLVSPDMAILDIVRADTAAHGSAPACVLCDESQFFTPAQADRVAYLVGHHHTYTNIDGMDYQILVEADFLVNLYEDSVPKAAAQNALDKIFKTQTGKTICKEMFAL